MKGFFFLVFAVLLKEAYQQDYYYYDDVAVLIVIIITIYACYNSNTGNGNKYFAGLRTLKDEYNVKHIRGREQELGEIAANVTHLLGRVKNNSADWTLRQAHNQFRVNDINPNI